ncbi:hypothetical protein, partial [Lactobacillus crispatus]|uniref:hypothetical protein n=1 Tax=Lactobacillus crispatus TaxID=47770 RepID=UPI0022AC3504
TQQKNSSSNIFPHSLTVALNLTIQELNLGFNSKKIPLNQGLYVPRFDGILKFLCFFPDTFYY